jgi:glucans biosynthesis protein C
MAGEVGQDRWHSLDALRAGALLLGIFLHASMAYLPGFREVRWPIADGSTSAALGIAFFVIHVFRMSVFFLIAGFFSRALRERLGTGGFVKNRLRRIALPLLAFYLLVTPFTFIAFIWGMRQLGLPGPPLVPPPAPLVGPPMPWGHLWFLYLLLLLYVAVVAGRSLCTALDARGSFRTAVTRLFGVLMSSRLMALVLAAPVAASLYAVSWWQPWHGIPAPLIGFVPNVPALLAYGGAFVCGWLMHRETRALGSLAAAWPLHLAAAIVSTAVALALVGITPRFGPVPLSVGSRATYAFAYLLATWCWTFALVGLAVRLLSAASTRWRYLADASYWIYIVHLPIVWLLQAWMLRWPLHWSVKFVLVIALTGAFLLLTYHYLVRSTFLGVFLNGRRYPRAAVPAAPAPSTSRG